MNWTMQMFKQLAAGVSGLFGLLADIADFAAPFAPYLMAISGAALVVLGGIKLFTEWGQNLYASIIFFVSIFVASLGLHFVNGEEATQRIAALAPKISDKMRPVTEPLQRFTNELKREYDQIDGRIKEGGAILRHRKLIVNAARCPVYAAPQKQAKVRFTLRKGANVILLARKGDWLKIKDAHDHVGWAQQRAFEHP